jgi:hypothetical protein
MEKLGHIQISKMEDWWGVEVDDEKERSVMCRNMKWRLDEAVQ